MASYKGVSMRMTWRMGCFLAAWLGAEGCNDPDLVDAAVDASPGKDSRVIIDVAISTEETPIRPDGGLPDDPDGPVAMDVDATALDATLGTDANARTDGESGLAGCFAQAEFKNCNLYCTKAGLACFAKGCGGLTYRLYQSKATCEASTSATGTSSQDCSATIPSVGMGTTIRCCCK